MADSSAVLEGVPNVSRFARGAPAPSAAPSTASLATAPTVTRIPRGRRQYQRWLNGVCAATANPLVLSSSRVSPHVGASSAAGPALEPRRRLRTESDVRDSDSVAAAARHTPLSSPAQRT